jgi:transaldolase
MTSNPLIQLRDAGQSPWCDNVSRGFIQEKLTGWISAGEITGLTSNPTIFEKAMADSREYDEPFEELARASKSAPEIFDTLAVQDIQAVADLLRPVYERTNRRDGYVSLEEAPSLAYDTGASINEAHRLFDLVGRQNVMIKIPGTPQGIPAFEQAIAEGVNVNVTLLFSIESYEQVAWAYITGLERRLAAGQPIDHVASVASFFVSRVDTAVDKQLEERIEQGETELGGLLGKAAIANAKMMYQSFKRIFGDPRFQALKAKGAMLQRPLWGSTSTKDPRYPDVMYVDELIGPDTVNTMPPATIDAFRDHGKVTRTLEEDVPHAEETFRRLATAGIDMDSVTRQLQADGVRLFAESYDQLIEAIERKRATMAGQRVEKAGVT